MSLARKDQLLDIGARLAAKHGLGNVTRRMVASEAKVSEALVSSYMGNVEESRGQYKARARRLGLKLPDAATEAELGLQLRAHGPRVKAAKRKRTVKEVKAIKRKAQPSVCVRGNIVTVKTRRSGGDARDVDVRPAIAAAKRSAARQPVLPPLIPVE